MFRVLILGSSLIFYFVAIFFVLSGTAWSQCTFTLNPTSAQAPAVTSTGSFAVTASGSNCSRTAGSNVNWLTVTFGQTGTGNGSVGYTVNTNPTYATRTGTISVSGAVFTVTQAAQPCPPSTFSPLGQTVQPAGGSFSIAVTSPCGWNAGSDASWIVLSASSGSGSGTLSYTIAPNNSGVSRTGIIQIDSVNFTVTQFSIDCTFTISPVSVNVGAGGGQNQIAVQATNSACPWTVQNTASWITLNGNLGASSSGNGAVAFTVAANTSPQPRTATLTVAGQPVTINQAGNICAFTLSPASIDVPYSATAGTFSVATVSPTAPGRPRATTAGSR